MLRNSTKLFKKKKSNKHALSKGKISTNPLQGLKEHLFAIETMLSGNDIEDSKFDSPFILNKCGINSFRHTVGATSFLCV